MKSRDEGKDMKPSTYRPLPEELGLERILNVQQAAELFGVSVATFRRLHWAGKLPPAIRLSERRLGWRARDLVKHLTAVGGVTV
jgi:predicted DNA-binding transcriptional regulator AlpA